MKLLGISKLFIYVTNRKQTYDPICALSRANQIRYCYRTFPARQHPRHVASGLQTKILSSWKNSRKPYRRVTPTFLPTPHPYSFPAIVSVILVAPRSRTRKSVLEGSGERKRATPAHGANTGLWEVLRTRLVTTLPNGPVTALVSDRTDLPWTAG
jgi:hypothetical protein